MMDVSQIHETKGLNPRKSIDPSYIASLKASMRSKVNQIDAILIQKGSSELIDGKERLQALSELHIKQVEVKELDVNDNEARRIALVTNVLKRNLTDIEIGQAAHEMISKTSHGRRQSEKTELAKELGVNIKTLDGYMASYRGIDSEIRDDVNQKVSEGTFGKHHLETLRQMRPERQKAIVKRIGTLKKPSSTVAGEMLSAFNSITKDLDKRTTPVSHENLPAKKDPIIKLSPPLPFLTVQSAEILSLRGGSVWFKDDKGREVDLVARVQELASKAKIGDRVTIKINLIQVIKL